MPMIFTSPIAILVLAVEYQGTSSCMISKTGYSLPNTTRGTTFTQ